VYRLRGLDRRGRWVAAGFALALSLAPALALAWAAPQWSPTADGALIGLRALDVGTTRTPLIGQPSSAGDYRVRAEQVSHPGATESYLLALPVRLFGGTAMIVVIALIVEACLLIAAWAVFRQLGPAAGILAAALLGAITFTTGASSLVDPVNSSAAGYPLLCAAVLCWCILAGDIRLLPLATGVTSFAAHSHLSVAPAVAVFSASAVVGVVAAFRRDRGDVLRWCGWAAVVGIALWTPALVQQLASADGNLGRLVTYANRDRATLGVRSAVHQVVNALGLPPLLGQTGVTGWRLIEPPLFMSWIVAAALLALVAALGWSWRQRRKHAALAAMVLVAVIAGVANGSSVPLGLFEQGRIAFYHWTFALALFTFLTLGLGVIALVGSRVRIGGPTVAAGASLALLAIIVPAAVNPSLDRATNTLPRAHAFIDRRFVDRLADAVMAHRGVRAGATLLLARGEGLYSGYRDALAFALTDRGVDVRHPRAYRGFVANGRLTNRATVDRGLVLVSLDDRRRSYPGRSLVEVHPASGLDVDAYAALIRRVRAAGEVRVGSDTAAAVAAIRDDGRQLRMWAALGNLSAAPSEALTEEALRFLLDHPIESPRLDPTLIRRVLDSGPTGWTPDTAFGLRLYLLTREQVLRLASPSEL
jgi:hypothetical protein